MYIYYYFLKVKRSEEGTCTRRRKESQSKEWTAGNGIKDKQGSDHSKMCCLSDSYSFITRFNHTAASKSNSANTSIYY